MKKLFKSISPSSLIGFAISTFLLWLLLKQSSLEWQQVTGSLKSYTSLFYMLLAMLSFVAMVVVQSYKVKMFFKDSRTKFSQISTYPSLAIGNLYNCLLPGNLGEGIRAWHFSKVNDRPLTQSASVFFTEKILGAILLAPILVIAILFFPFIDHYVQYGIIILLSVIMLVSVLIIVFYSSRKLRKLIFQIIPFKSVRKSLFKVLLHLFGNLKRMYSNKMVKYFIVVAYTMFLLNIVQYYFILMAVGIDEQLLTFSTAGMLSVSMMLVMVIPSAPGNIGVAHYGVYITLMFMAEINGLEINSIMKQKFAIVGICLHFSYYIPEILIGLFYVVKDHKRIFQFTPIKI